MKKIILVIGIVILVCLGCRYFENFRIRQEYDLYEIDKCINLNNFWDYNNNRCLIFPITEGNRYVPGFSYQSEDLACNYTIRVIIPFTQNKFIFNSLKIKYDEIINEFTSNGCYDSFRNVSRATLDLESEVYESKKTVSYLIKNDSYTGGVHPAQFYYSKNFSKKQKRELDLFNDIIKNNKFIEVVKKVKIKLKNKFGDELWEDGANAIKDNYKVWYIDGDNINFVFPPYKVAPYAAGTQVVTINMKTNQSLFRIIN